MTFTVREANIDDLDVLVSFILAEAEDAEGRALPAEVVRRGIHVGLEDPTVARYWVLESPEGEVVGNVSVVREWSDWHAVYYWWIQSIFINPEQRGKNLVALLLDEAAHQAKREGAMDLRLYVHQDNARAIKAYRKQGFTDPPYRIMRRDL